MNMPKPQGDYRPAVVHGGVAYSAGMTPRVGGELVVRGRVGAEVSVADATEAANLAAGNALAAIQLSLPPGRRIERCLRMTVYVAGAAGFEQHSVVADGASRRLLAELGEAGRVARSAVGVANLPGGAPVEVELTVAIGTEDGGSSAARPRGGAGPRGTAGPG